MFRRLFTVLSCICALGMFAAAAKASAQDDEFPIAGTFSQNKPCPADGVVSKRLQVTITRQEIVYASGTCTISDIRRKEQTFTVHTACRMQGGKILSSDVMFTVRDDSHLDMIDQFASYKAVLYRCSGEASKAESEPSAPGR